MSDDDDVQATVVRLVGKSKSEVIAKGALACASSVRASPNDMASAVSFLILSTMDAYASFGAEPKRFRRLLAILQEYRGPQDWDAIRDAIRVAQEDLAAGHA